MSRCVSNTDGTYTQVSRFDTRLMMSPKDIFPNNKELAAKYIVKKDLNKKIYPHKEYKVEDKSSLVRLIFRFCIKTIINDVISGECKFVMPYNSSGEIYMGKKPDSVVRHKCQNESNQFDMITTNRVIPQLKYKVSNNVARKDLNIYVSPSKYKLIVDRANKGLNFSKRPRELSYFLPRVYQKFNLINEKSIRSLLFYCFRKMGNHIRKGEEIRFIDKEGEIRFYRNLGDAHDFVMRNVVNKRKK